MKKPNCVMSLLLAVVLVLSLIPAARVQAISDSPAPYTNFFSESEWEVLKLVNKERHAQGEKPLTSFPELQGIADIRAAELVEKYSHTRPDGRGCFTAYTEAGVYYFAAGENIAVGYYDAADVMNGWMNSPGHRGNILQTSFDCIGVGYHYEANSQYGRHWAQNFMGDNISYTTYRVVMPNGSVFPAGTTFDEMDIYLLLDSDADNYDYYLPLTEELVSGFVNEIGTMTVTFDLLGLSGSFDVTVGETAPVNPFSDVPESSFYYEPVMWAVEKGITSGATATTFNPNSDCLRAQVVTFLWRAEGCPEPRSSSNPFVDVKESDFYYKAVLWAVENGITNGLSVTQFGPNASCNRAQVVTFLHRVFGSPSVENAANPFSDVPADAWYTVPVLWAVENGITNGLSATQFGPNSNCNRAQIVTFLYRAYTE